MTTDIHEPPDPPLDAAQSALAAALTPAQIQAIDTALLRHAAAEPRKVARVVSAAMWDVGAAHPGLPDVFYARRIALLVERGELEASGDLARMRWSEVRLPG